MNTSQFVAEVAKKAGLTNKQAGEFLSAVLETVQETVAAGGEVHLYGFGTWRRVEVKGGVGRNPNTGEPVAYGDTVRPSWSAGDTFKRVVKTAAKVSAAA